MNSPFHNSRGNSVCKPALSDGSLVALFYELDNWITTSSMFINIVNLTAVTTSLNLEFSSEILDHRWNPPELGVQVLDDSDGSLAVRRLGILWKILKV